MSSFFPEVPVPEAASAQPEVPVVEQISPAPEFINMKQRPHHMPGYVQNHQIVFDGSIREIKDDPSLLEGVVHVC